MEQLHDSLGLKSFLYRCLHNDSLLNIGQRKDLYNAILNFVKCISSSPSKLSLSFVTSRLYQDEGDYGDCTESGSIRSLLSVLAVQAGTYIKLSQTTGIEHHDQNAMYALSMAEHLKEISVHVVKFCRRCRSLGLCSSSSSVEVNTSSSSSSSSSHEKNYLKTLRPQKFGSIELCEMIDCGRASHHYLSNKHMQTSNGRSTGDPRSRLTRISRELSTLSTTLPVEWGSSVFLRSDDTRPDIMKALIIGPEGTPYGNIYTITYSDQMVCG